MKEDNGQVQIKSPDMEVDQELFQKAFQGSPIAMFVHEMDTGEIIMANPAALSCFGLTSVEELKTFDSWLEPPYLFEDFLFWIKKASSEGPQRFQWKSRKVTGEVFWDDIYISIISIGGENKVLTICIDISEKIRAQEMLKESEKKYRIIADYTADCEYWQLQDGTISYISPTCEKITGYSREDFISDPDLFLKIIHPDDREKAVCLLPDIKARIREDHNEVDFRIQTRDGRERWIGHKCRPVFSSRGMYLGRRVSNRDITEKKDREKALQDLALELKKRNQALDEALEKSRTIDQAAITIIENTVHKILNPITAALGFARFLENDAGLNHEQAGHVRNILCGLEQVLETVNNLREVPWKKPARDAAEGAAALHADEPWPDALSHQPGPIEVRPVLTGEMEEAAAVLPGELASEMMGAVSQGDMAVLEDLMDQVNHTHAANALKKLAGNYEYEKLTALLEKAIHRS
jgi:PAS domain S-box-containing protein